MTRADGVSVVERYAWGSDTATPIRNLYVGVCRIAGGIVTDCREEPH